MQTCSSIMNVHSCPIRSASIYDTARTHLPSSTQDRVYDRTQAKENVGMAHKVDNVLQVTDDQFYQTPDSSLRGRLHPERPCETLQSKMISVHVHPLLEKATHPKFGKCGSSNSVDFVKAANNELFSLLRPYGLPLDTIPEGDSASSLRSKRSSSAVLVRTTSRNELHMSKLHYRRSSSAPCLLSSNLRTAASVIREGTPMADGEQEEDRSRMVKSTEHLKANEMVSKIESWVNTNPGNAHYGADQANRVPETWPTRKAPKRTPAASIREIFERLLAAGLTSYSSGVNATSKDFNKPDLFPPHSPSTDHEPSVDEDQCNLNTSDSVCNKNDARIAEIRHSSGASSLLRQLLPSDNQHESVAVSALKNVLAPKKRSILPSRKAFERKGSPHSQNLLHTTPEQKSGVRSCSSRQSRGSTVPSLKEMAESLRVISSEEPTPYRGDLKVTNRSSIDIAALSSGSSTRSMDFGTLYWQTPPQSGRQRGQHRPSSYTLDGSELDLSISNGPRLLSTHIKNPLVPSPLRPLPKRTPNLSLFPACPAQTPYQAATPLKGWRSISSRLRFSQRNDVRKGPVHSYDCQHGHRIVSTSSYAGVKLKSSLFHTDGFRINTPENCWRCSVKDICNKILQDLSVAGMRQKHDRKTGAPLFIDPYPGAVHDLEPPKARHVSDATGPERDIRDLLSKAAEQLPRHRRVRSDSSKSTRFVTRFKKPTKMLSNVNGKGSQGDSYKNRVMLWVTRNGVLCRKDETSLQSQPCSDTSKSVRPAAARTPID